MYFYLQIYVENFIVIDLNGFNSYVNKPFQQKFRDNSYNIKITSYTKRINTSRLILFHNQLMMNFILINHLVT